MSIFLPALSDVQLSREMIGAFGGYNKQSSITDSEFSDMENLTSDAYPLLSVRARRAKLRTFTKPNGLFAHEKLCWVDGTAFYYDGQKKGDVTDSPKQFVTMGAMVLIWPDKACYNTHTDEFTSLEATATTTGTITITLCKRTGEPYDDLITSASVPDNPKNGQLWLDTSTTPNVLRLYSELSGVWSAVPTTFVKVAATGIGVGFKENDGVTVEGIEGADSLNGSFVLYGVGDDYVILTGLVPSQLTQTAPVTIKRSVPDMDFIVENENRLWGCSSANHEIYASVLGDPTNFNRYLGISTDSYTATVGSKGVFTGCASHLGYVLFFKETVIHKMYGSQPSKFQLTNTNCRGVQQGAEHSIVTVNETLFYKSSADVCAYNSALPQSVSAALGSTPYTCNGAGSLGNKYYISLTDASGVSSLFVFDSARGLWHREDNTCATYFAALDGDLYFIDESDNTLCSVTGKTDRYGENTSVEGPLFWYAETGDIGLTSPDAKTVTSLQLRVEIGDNSLLRIETKYPHDTFFTEEKRLNMTRLTSFTVPIFPRRCDSMRIRFSGVGTCKVYSITKTIEQGGPY